MRWYEEHVWEHIGNNKNPKNIIILPPHPFFKKKVGKFKPLGCMLTQLIGYKNVFCLPYSVFCHFWPTLTAPTLITKHLFTKHTLLYEPHHTFTSTFPNLMLKKKVLWLFMRWTLGSIWCFLCKFGGKKWCKGKDRNLPLWMHSEHLIICCVIAKDELE
jgi:hypothetical protein